MQFSNVLVVTFFLAIVCFQISCWSLGYWSIGVYLLVICASLFIFHCSIKNCSPNCDFPSLWWLLPKHVSSNLIAEEGTSADSLTICLVCDDLNCDKHDPELLVYLQPWKHLLVDARVNCELEKLFGQLLEQHTSWLKDISHNREEILQELKRLIRLVTASLLLRIKKRLKWNDILLRKLPKYLTHHLEMYIYGKRKAKSARFLEESVLRQYGNLLHPALVSAQHEAKFLKSIANLLIHTTLPFKFTKCEVSRAFLSEFVCCCILTPLVDILIEPDKVNTFLIFLLDKNENPPLLDPMALDNAQVEFLVNFSDLKRQFDLDYLGIEKKQIFEDQHLLFLFSQFAKEEHFLNVVQFVMHMNTFMNQITNPDLSDSQLQSLHSHLVNIHEQYLTATSRDYINFDSSIQASFAQAVHGHYNSIQQFRNCKSLYEAYEFANEILEHYCHKFFHTDVYLKLICGQRSLSFNLGYEEYCQEHDDPTLELERGALRSSDTDCMLDTQKEIKDLSAWTVLIVNVNNKFDIVGREIFYFEIEVTELDDRKWIVERQFHEFYILATKLREFHGDELDTFLLPTRKPFLRVNKSLMESYRYDFEQFLRDLLTNVYLKRSELVYNFLSSNDFNYSYFGDNFNLGKMIKNVPSKFSKERGQHLYSFLKNFIASCEKPSTATQDDEDNNGGKDKRSKEANKRPGGSSTRPARHSSDSVDLSEVESASTNHNYAHLEYLYDYLLLVLIRFYNLNNWILHLLLMLRPLLRQTFQAVCEYFVSWQLRRTLFTAPRMSQFIADLRQTLTDPPEQESGTVESATDSIAHLTKSQRSQKALNLLEEYIPKWLVEQTVDFNKHEEAVFLLFSLLQHRLLNKQLLYLILNSLVTDLVPEPIYQTID